MKHILLACLLLCSLVSNAQVYDIYDSAISYRFAAPVFSIAADTLVARAVIPGDTGWENPSYTLQRYLNFTGSRMCFDVPLGADMTTPARSALRTYMGYSLLSACSGAAAWQCLGPSISTYGSKTNYPGTCEDQGRIISLWVDPARDSTILAGADCGGLWKSTDLGNTWHNLTDGTGGNNVLGMPGVTSIAVNPLNNNIIYVALGSDGSQEQKAGPYYLGLAYTTDGGNTWNTDTVFDDTANGGLPTQVQQVAYMPGTQKLFPPLLVLFSDQQQLAQDR